MRSRRDFFGQSFGLAALAACGWLGMTNSTGAKTVASARQAGFRVPLESDLHELTFMQWPSRASISGGSRKLEAVRARIVLIARSIAQFEPVVVLAPPAQSEDAAKALGPGI